MEIISLRLDLNGLKNDKQRNFLSLFSITNVNNKKTYTVNLISLCNKNTQLKNFTNLAIFVAYQITYRISGCPQSLMKKAKAKICKQNYVLVK